MMEEEVERGRKRKGTEPQEYVQDYGSRFASSSSSSSTPARVRIRADPYNRAATGTAAR